MPITAGTSRLLCIHAHTERKGIGYRVAKPERTASYGGLKDWFINEYDRPGFTLECGYGKNPLPESDAGVIYAGIRRGIILFPAMGGQGGQE